MKEEAVPYDEMTPRAPADAFSIDSVVAGVGPVELDIGFGRGTSVFRRAAAAPDARILGIEVKAKLSYQVSERVRKRGLAGRITIWGGDVKAILARVQEDAFVSHVFLHFPDPWWKKRHGKRLVLEPEFLKTLARVMKDGAVLFVQTDVEERHLEYLATVRESSDFEVFATESADNPFGSVSNREIRAVEDGLPIYRLIVRRKDRGL